MVEGRSVIHGGAHNGKSKRDIHAGIGTRPICQTLFLENSRFFPGIFGLRSSIFSLTDIPFGKPWQERPPAEGGTAMENIYERLAARTGGNIYVGVVGQKPYCAFSSL